MLLYSVIGKRNSNACSPPPIYHSSHSNTQLPSTSACSLLLPYLHYAPNKGSVAVVIVDVGITYCCCCWNFTFHIKISVLFFSFNGRRRRRRRVCWLHFDHRSSPPSPPPPSSPVCLRRPCDVRAGNLVRFIYTLQSLFLPCRHFCCCCWWWY